MWVHGPLDWSIRQPKLLCCTSFPHVVICCCFGLKTCGKPRGGYSRVKVYIYIYVCVCGVHLARHHCLIHRYVCVCVVVGKGSSRVHARNVYALHTHACSCWIYLRLELIYWGGRRFLAPRKIRSKQWDKLTSTARTNIRLIYWTPSPIKNCWNCVLNLKRIIFPLGIPSNVDKWCEYFAGIFTLLTFCF